MIPEFPEFKKIELSDKEEVERITKQFPPYSDFNFVSMWSWDTQSQTELSVLNGNLVVKFNDYLSKEPFYSFIGVNSLEDTIYKLTDLSSDKGIGSKLKFISSEVALLNKNPDCLLIPDQDNFDYVYDVPEFMACEGKKYETQRNQIHRFEKKYPNYAVKVFDDFSEIKEQILVLEQRWKLNKIKQDKILEFRNESQALHRIFDLDYRNFLTVCVYVEDELVGFCVNELLPDSAYALSHFAKADISFNGIYSFLLQQTCGALYAHGKQYLNYEQDLGLVYLRNSKTSFRPSHFLKKFTLIRQ